MTLIAYGPDGEPVAILPLAERRSQGLRHLVLGGYSQPYRSFPAKSSLAGPATRAMVEAVFRVPGWDVLRFGPWDAVTPERAALAAALTGRGGHRLVVGRGTASLVRLPWTPPETAVPFEREVGARVRHLTRPDPADTAALFRELATIESNSLEAVESGASRFLSETDQLFWRGVTDHALAPGGQLEVWVADLWGKPVAFRVVIRVGSVDYLVAAQADDAVAHLRPQDVLFRHHCRTAAERGIRAVEASPADPADPAAADPVTRQDDFVFRDSLRGGLLKSALGALVEAQRVLGVGAITPRTALGVAGLFAAG